MKVAIFGNGKMGKRITSLAIQKGYFISETASSKIPGDTLKLNKVDVVIDFSTPSSAYNNIAHAIKKGIPVVSGTTGWLDKIKDIEILSKKKNGAFLYASNFSFGANILFEINKRLAKLVKGHNYNPIIHETHHTDKLDSPSGTAKSIANEIRVILKKEPSITSERINDAIGTHIVSYTSLIDKIELKHTAKNRDGFALGALLAAEWIIGKEGVFNMTDVMNDIVKY